jgi:hypothetical protein
MNSHRLSRTIGVIGVLVLGVVGVLSAQALQGDSSSTLAELLTEVRGLRADVNQAAGTSMRMQLLVARLSLQEQRINVVGRQLSDITTQLDAATLQRTQVEDRVKGLEASAASHTLSPDQQREIDGAVTGDRANLQRLQAHEQQLRSQATEIANLLASEQNRWTDFNNRLDDLERSLPPGTSR